MKVYTSLLIVPIFFCSGFSNLCSQKLIVPEKKMYETPEGKLFIQKELPIYLMVGTDPNNKNDSKILKSEKTPEYANPLYLDTEGFNSFRTPTAVDKVTKKVILPKRDIFFEIYADSKPPVSSISFEKGKTHRQNNKVFINGDTELHFSATDQLSGVDKVLVSIDSADFTEYTSPIKLDAEKNYFIKYYSFDHVGNMERVKSLSVCIDRSSPTTSFETKGEQSENILSGQSLIILKNETDSSGIGNLMVKIDGKPEYPYKGAINTATLTQGEHKLVYYAVDKVGNKETPHEYEFYVDKKPPTILQDIVGKSFMVNGKEFSSGNSLLKLTALDNKAGVKEIYYSINNEKYKLYEKPVVLTSIKGNLSVKAYAVDKVNNKSLVSDAAQESQVPYIDLSGPSLNYNLIGPVFLTSDTIYINSKTKIQLKAFDNEAGLNNIQYRIDNNEQQLYSEPFAITGEGLHTIEYTGSDNVENTNTTSFKVIVDNTGPVIYNRFSTALKGTTVEDGQNIEIYPGYVNLFVSATDISSGYERMTYILNSLPERSFTGFLSGMAGKNKLVIKAFDKLGNETTSQLEFIIQN